MTRQRQIEVRDSLEAIQASQWNALNTDGNPFLQHEFLHTLDTTGCLGQATGWYPRYFLMWNGSETDDNRELLGAVASYVKTNSYGEFVFDWSWAEAFEKHQVEYYPKLVCSIPFTPATGRRILVRADQDQEYAVTLLAAAVRQFADAEQYSGVHYLFLTEFESKILCSASREPLTSELATESSASDPSKVSETAATSTGTSDSNNVADCNDSKRATTLQALNMACSHLHRIDCQFHWFNNAYSDFDDFLSRCNAKRRKTIRRERRYVNDAGLRVEQRLGNTLSTQEWQWVHEFYQSTFDRKWGNPSLTPAFFTEIGEKMGNQMLIVFAYDPQDDIPDWPVACSIMFVGGDTLYGRYWGCRADFNALHFEACYYQGIEYCIANGIGKFEPGAQGEHKITRGFVPTITQSAHHIRHPGFHQAIADYLDHERPHVEQRCTGLTDLLPFRSEPISL